MTSAISVGTRQVKSTCPYCGVGCGIVLNVDERNQITWVDDDPGNLSSLGMLCVKGRFATGFVTHPDRLTHPLIKRNGEFQQASWDQALDYIAERLLPHREAFGSFASAKATNEDAFIQQKFVRLLSFVHAAGLSMHAHPARPQRRSGGTGPAATRGTRARRRPTARRRSR